MEKETVQQYVEKNISLISNNCTSLVELDHITNLCMSIVNTRDNVMRGGSFVQAICNNDLQGAIQRADSTTINALRLFVNVYLYLH